MQKKGDKHSYFTYFIRASNRDKMAKFLFDNGVYTTLRYHPLHLNPSLSMDDVDLIVSLCKKFVTGNHGE